MALTSIHLMINVIPIVIYGYLSWAVQGLWSVTFLKHPKSIAMAMR